MQTTHNHRTELPSSTSAGEDLLIKSNERLDIKIISTESIDGDGDNEESALLLGFPIFQKDPPPKFIGIASESTNTAWSKAGKELARIFEGLDNPYFLVLVYFGLNLSITIYNKVILKLFHFNFPWLLTACHSLLSCVGASVLVHGLKTVKPASLDLRQDLPSILAFSVLYTVNIAISNVSLNMVSLPFHQIVRSTNPAVTLTLEYIILKRVVKGWSIYASCCLVIIGVALATLGEYEFTNLGFMTTLLGVVLSSMKGIATNALLVGNLKLHPLDLLWRMSGLAFFQCLLMAYLVGEVHGCVVMVRRLSLQTTSGIEDALTKSASSVSSSSSTTMTGILTPWLLFLALLANAVMAFFLNFVSFSANRKVGALSMAVAGNVKQSVTILLSVWIFGYVIALVNGCGILITLIGGAWYSAIGVMRKRKQQRQLPVSAVGFSPEKQQPETAEWESFSHKPLKVKFSPGPTSISTHKSRGLV